MYKHTLTLNQISKNILIPREQYYSEEAASIVVPQCSASTLLF